MIRVSSRMDNVGTRTGMGMRTWAQEMPPIPGKPSLT